MIIGHVILAVFVACVATVLLWFNGYTFAILILAYSLIGATHLLATVLIENAVKHYRSRFYLAKE
jgi:hypothetical protein